MQNILVTGANGQLGSEIQQLEESNTQFKMFFTDVKELDITNEEAVESYVVSNKMDAIVNCAAYTAVDKAEDEIQLATLVNVKGPEVLSKVSGKHGITFIHVSTDYVFNGENFKPYTEEDEVSPLGVYGKTKLDGELAALAHNKHTLVIRTSWLYSSFGNNFVKTMMRLMSERDQIGVIFDQVGTPTYAADLANAILKAVSDKDIRQKAGIYHFSNEGAISWYDFAQAIKEIEGYTCTIKPLQSHEFPAKTKRPHYSVLNKTKIKTAFIVEIPFWRNALKVCLKQINDVSLYDA